MELTIECFGVTARLTGAARHTLRVPAGGTVRQALSALAERFPALAGELDRCACAIGDTVVTRAQLLQPGERLALLPPVSGG